MDWRSVVKKMFKQGLVFDVGVRDEVSETLARCTVPGCNGSFRQSS